MHSTLTASEGSFIQKDIDLNDDENAWNHLHSSNDGPEHCSEVVDLVDALPSESTQLEPSESVLDVDEADTVIWTPSEHLIRLDDDEVVVITVNYDYNEEDTQVRPGTFMHNVV